VLRSIVWNLASFGVVIVGATYVGPYICRSLNCDSSPNGDDYMKRSGFKDEYEYLSYRAVHNA